MCLDDDSVDKTRLNGYHKCTQDIKKYLTVAALTSSPAEALLSALLTDPCFLKHGPRCWDVMMEALEWLNVSVINS